MCTRAGAAVAARNMWLVWVVRDGGLLAAVAPELAHAASDAAPRERAKSSEGAQRNSRQNPLNVAAVVRDHTTTINPLNVAGGTAVDIASGPAVTPAGVTSLQELVRARVIMHYTGSSAEVLGRAWPDMEVKKGRPAWGDILTAFAAWRRPDANDAPVAVLSCAPMVMLADLQAAVERANASTSVEFCLHKEVFEF